MTATPTIQGTGLSLVPVPSGCHAPVGDYTTYWWDITKAAADHPEWGIDTGTATLRLYIRASYGSGVLSIGMSQDEKPPAHGLMTARRTSRYSAPILDRAITSESRDSKRTPTAVFRALGVILAADPESFSNPETGFFRLLNLLGVRPYSAKGHAWWKDLWPSSLGQIGWAAKQFVVNGDGESLTLVTNHHTQTGHILFSARPNWSLTPDNKTPKSFKDLAGDFFTDYERLSIRSQPRPETILELKRILGDEQVERALFAVQMAR